MILPKISNCRSECILIHVTKFSSSSHNTRSVDHVFTSTIDTRPERVRPLSIVFKRFALANETKRRSK